MSRRTNIMVSRTLYQLGVTTLIISLIWVVLAVYQAMQKPATGSVPKEVLEPLSPKINEEALEKLKGRRQMAESSWQELAEQEAILEEVLPTSQSAELAEP